MNADPNCIFCKIVAGQIPSRKAYEDDELLAFHDIHPWAPVHLLIVPKLHLASLADVQPAHEKWLGKMLPPAPPARPHRSRSTPTSRRIRTRSTSKRRTSPKTEAAWNGSSAGRALGRPKPARIPSGDRPMYSSDEGPSLQHD